MYLKGAIVVVWTLFLVSAPITSSSRSATPERMGTSFSNSNDSGPRDARPAFAFESSSVWSIISSNNVFIMLHRLLLVVLNFTFQGRIYGLRLLRVRGSGLGS